MKINKIVLLMVLLFLPMALLAGPSKIVSISYIPANPNYGDLVRVTVNICASVFADPRLVVAISTQGTPQTAGAGGQIFVADANGIDRKDVTFPSGGTQLGVDLGNTSGPAPAGQCTDCGSADGFPMTLVYDVHMPTADYFSGVCNPTNFYIVAGLKDFSLNVGDWSALPASGCNGNGSTFAISMPMIVPPPSNKLADRYEGSLTAAGDELLYAVDYSYGGSGAFAITDPVPGGGDFTIVAFGPTMIPGGSVSGPAIGLTAGTYVWNFPARGAQAGMQSGTVWMLLKLNTYTAGKVYTNTATPAQAGAATTGPVTASVVSGAPAISISKTESVGSLLMGQNITYVLSYDINGYALKNFQPFDNIAVGTYTGGTAPPGWLDEPQNGDPGTWTIKDPCGTGGTYLTGSGGASNYPGLLLGGVAAPSNQFCEGMIVSDFYIEDSAYSGADAQIIVRSNGQTGTNGRSIGVLASIDDNPATLYLSVCGGTGPGPFCGAKGPAGSFSDMPQVGLISSKKWYRMRIVSACVGGGEQIQARVWARGDPEPGNWDINYTLAGACTSADWKCDGTGTYTDWRPGINQQTGDGASVQDSYDNFTTYAPRVTAANTQVYDTIPTGVTYVGNAGGCSTAGGVVNCPIGSVSLTSGSFTWWGTVTGACNSTISNQAMIDYASGNAAPIGSNWVSASILCWSPTSTVTITPSSTWFPSNTVTRTFTQSCTPTFVGGTSTLTGTPTFSPTYTKIPTQTFTITLGGTSTFTRTATPVMPVSQSPTVTVTRTFTPTFTVTLTMPVGTSIPTATRTFTGTVTPSLTPILPSGLFSCMNVSPNPAQLGQNVTVVMAVNNIGSNQVDNVVPAAGYPVVTGPASAVLVAGPLPASLTISPSGYGYFTWIYNATSAGSLGFSGSAQGTDHMTSLPVNGTDTIMPLLMWGTAGTGDGQFNDPQAVAVDENGDIYVSDNNDRIQKFNSSGVFILKWGTSGTGNGQFMNGISSIAADKNGHIYAVDGSNHRIQKFNLSGTYLGQWGSSGTGNGQFSNPVGIAADNSGNIFVSDQGNSNIQKFDTNGSFITRWGSAGAGNGQFSALMLLATDSSGNVYAAEGGNDRIQKFDNNGNYLTQWGSHGMNDTQFNYPWGVAVDPSGNVYVTETYHGFPPAANRVKKFTSDGAFITKWGGVLGSGPGQFLMPLGLAVDASGSIYVADQSNNRVQKFGLISQCSGEFIVVAAGGTLTPTFTITPTPTLTLYATPFITPTPNGFYPGNIVITYGPGNNGAMNSCTDGAGNIFTVSLEWDGPCGCYVIYIYKYLPDGFLDLTFGTAGKMKCPGPIVHYVWNDQITIKCDASGRLVIAAYADPCGGTCADMIIYRCTASGAPDLTFNSTGYKICHNITWTGQSYGCSLDFDSTGKICCTGKAWNGTNYCMMTIKCNDDGSTDTTFGTGGTVTYCSAAGDCSGTSIKCHGGKIYITGYSDVFEAACSCVCREMYIWCYNEDGSIDNTFGTGGCCKYVNVAMNHKHCVPKCITITVGGKIIVTGEVDDNTGCTVICQSMVIWVYNSDGTPDTTFNGTGMVIDNGGGAGACGSQVFVDVDGKIIVIGTRHNGANMDICIWKYLPDGTIDATFGTNGRMTYDSGNDEEGLSILKITICRLIATGYTYTGPTSQYDQIIWNIEDMCPAHTATATPTPYMTFTITITPTPVNTLAAVCGTGCVDWNAATYGAAFGKRHEQGSVVFQNKMWVITGADAAYPHYRDSWWSTNGSDWFAATLNTAFMGRSAAAFVTYDDGSGEKIWMFGGNVNGTNCNEVWNSANGADWNLVTGNADWTPKFGQAAVVYNNKMWLVGGGTASSGPPYGHTAEVWSSTNGINWTEATASAAFPGRAAASLVVFDNGTGSKMWLIGGGTQNDDIHRTSDVWYSSDGANWTEATANAGFDGRSNMGTVVYNNEIMTVAGFGNGGMFNDVWRSKDGIHWDSCNMAPPFAPRDTAGLVYNGMAWIIGGYDNNLTMNDVWYTCGAQMVASFTVTPTCSETVTPTFTVTPVVTATATAMPTCATGTPQFTVHLVYDPAHKDYVDMQITSSNKLIAPPSIVISAHGNCDKKPVFHVTATAEPLDTTGLKFEYKYPKQTGWGDIDTVSVSGTDVCGNAGVSDGTYTKETVSQKDLILFKNVINPEKGERCRIVYNAVEKGKATIKIYSKNGALIKTLFDGKCEAGTQPEVIWDGTNEKGQKCVSGIYIAAVDSDNVKATQKIAVVH